VAPARARAGGSPGGSTASGTSGATTLGGAGGVGGVGGTTAGGVGATGGCGEIGGGICGWIFGAEPVGNPHAVSTFQVQTHPWIVVSICAEGAVSTVLPHVQFQTQTQVVGSPAAGGDDVGAVTGELAGAAASSGT